MSDTPTIYLVDDNEENLQLLQMYLSSKSFHVKPFASAEAFLATLPITEPSCLLLDNRMPGMSGIELQRALGDGTHPIAVVFMSGASSYDDVFEATRNGAVAFLQKPIHKDKLLQAINEAMTLARGIHAKTSSASHDRSLYDSLSRREKEVFHMLAEGKSNKMIARELDITLRTVEYHRSNVLKKLDVTLLADLIALARRLES